MSSASQCATTIQCGHNQWELHAWGIILTKSRVPSRKPHSWVQYLCAWDVWCHPDHLMGTRIPFICCPIYHNLAVLIILTYCSNNSEHTFSRKTDAYAIRQQQQLTKSQHSTYTLGHIPQLFKFTSLGYTVWVSIMSLSYTTATKHYGLSLERWLLLSSHCYEGIEGSKKQKSS